MARKGFVSGEGTVTDADAPTAAEKAKAVEIKKQLERLVKAIVDEDDYRVETADEAIRTLASLKDLKSQKSFSFKLAEGGSHGGGVLAGVPKEFICPISGELMADPVRWLNEGHRTCPQKNQVISHTVLTPNHLVREMISQWCREREIELPKPVQDIDEQLVTNADRGYLNSLLEKMSSSLSDQKAAAKELRLLTKRSSSFRALFGESTETIPQLLNPLSPGHVDAHPDLQENLITTEGCLVASTNRGFKAINLSGGATSVLLRDGMTRAPCVRFNSAKRAAELKFYLEEPNNYDTLSTVFNRSSRFGRLQTITCAIVGKNLYMRFICSTGDAMGMNMVSKGVQNVLDFLQNDFPDMDVIGISGNYCSDRKPAAVNWIEGRGKSVVCTPCLCSMVMVELFPLSPHAANKPRARHPGHHDQNQRRASLTAVKRLVGLQTRRLTLCFKLWLLLHFRHGRYL
ncbi:U-box domain-containing protein 9-like [Pyrus ussuriensis x Pyrus communis]|uniref:hydroxymethylglutaryl-CoA reductase (NADPH) n=1 Tax=Pyrus ussuriensis x Pyrus communis TaxID=2448454 RepID=A0A5N5HF63_9ROSA|nr:U-box domain-containing protein 9-like [Pyrus ussuriensis x Pyrus communis]